MGLSAILFWLTMESWLEGLIEGKRRVVFKDSPAIFKESTTTMVFPLIFLILIDFFTKEPFLKNSVSDFSLKYLIILIYHH